MAHAWSGNFDSHSHFWKEVQAPNLDNYFFRFQCNFKTSVVSYLDGQAQHASQDVQYVQIR